jgi:hypothetical protein
MAHHTHGAPLIYVCMAHPSQCAIASAPPIANYLFPPTPRLPPTPIPSLPSSPASPPPPTTHHLTLPKPRRRRPLHLLSAPLPPQAEPPTRPSLSPATTLSLPGHIFAATDAGRFRRLLPPRSTARARLAPVGLFPRRDSPLPASNAHPQPSARACCCSRQRRWCLPRARARRRSGASACWTRGGWRSSWTGCRTCRC